MFYHKVKKMKDYEFLSNIDNKEILTEILNNSIDFLIGNQDEQQTMRLCHKYGFHNPDDFLLATRSIAKLYRNMCYADQESHVAMLPPDLQTIVPAVLLSRREEVICFLMREQNAIECPLVESFDWDVRHILGDSSFDQNYRTLTTISFRLCSEASKRKERKQLHFQFDRNKLEDVINALESAVKNESH
ncbi:uncharacterized protein LOC106084870 [Stomoxys calcitrans]|uniref:uncharacterized protein LOC106084870 n=1 Tax=Stomoxys calcitrans TaxID=35570 RepID=UPI0027E26651|nr:uncharacterized protein LOC106084870 [Stomoxys calcitrans]